MAALLDFLANDDLLHCVLGHLSDQDVASARLCSHRFNAAASKLLFRTLRLGFRMQYLKLLQIVVASERFAGGVREIIWETGELSSTQHTGEIGEQAQIPDAVCLEGETTSPRWNSRKNALVRQEELAKEEGLLGNEQYLNLFVAALIHALPSLKGLRSLTFTNWITGTEAYDLQSFLASTHEHRTRSVENAAVEDRGSCLRRVQIVLSVLVALSSAGVQLASLSILPTAHPGLSAEAANEFGFAGMLIPIHCMPDELLAGLDQCLAKLSQLHIEMDIKHSVQEMVCISKEISGGGLASFLVRLSQIQELNIQMRGVFSNDTLEFVAVMPLDRVFPQQRFERMRKLTLGGFWLEAKELCSFIERQQQTLQKITLKDINLGGAATATATWLLPGVMVRVPSQSKPSLQRVSLEDCPEWKQVALACQTVRGLRGLDIRGPSFGRDRRALSLFDTMELIRIGMDGRPNNFVDEADGGFWALLEGLT